MPEQLADLPVLTSKLLDLPGVRHAFFTRRGGVSEGLYESLNVGAGSNDDPIHVAENRRRAAAHLGGTLVTAYQVHSAVAFGVEGAWPGGPPEGDAIVTKTPGVICGALAADCAPILLADAEARVVGAAHAGWKGALGGIAEAAIERMEALGADRRRIVAAIGPCIGPGSYEVGPEFQARFVQADVGNARFFQPGDADRFMFDLPAYVLDRLHKAGVDRAEWIGQDTCADADQFFSNRHAFHRGDADYGRLLSGIMLEA
jgi:YfiH family protein